MVVNPKQTRGRRASTRDETVDLMQLMRRRSRYRPYTANNNNNRSTFDIFPNARNRRYPLFPGSSVSRVRNRTSIFRNNLRSSNYFNEEGLYPDLNPLFYPFNRVRRHDVDTNTEIPCCSTHSLPPALDTEQTESKDEFVEPSLKHGKSPANDTGSKLDNSSIATTSKAAKIESIPDPKSSNLGKVVTSSKLPTESTQIISSPTNKNQMPGLALNRSKSTDPSSSDVSGSSLSYPEDNGLVRNQNINDNLSKNIVVIETCPNHSINLLNVNNSTSYTEAISNNNTSVPFVPKEQCAISSENETTVTYKNSENKCSAKNLERSCDDVSTRSAECINVRDSESNKSSSSENVEVNDTPEHAHTDTEESSSQDVVEISSRESNEEAPASSDSINLSSAQFAFIEVFPNPSTENNFSDSTISHEGNGSNLNTADSKAGGDGHHNDTLMQIEFSLATVMNANDEDMESNPEGEEDNEDT